MPFLKELGSNRLFPIFTQIFYIVLIFVTVIVGGWFLIGKIQNVNKLLASETKKYQASSEKLTYLKAFPYDTATLLRKMNYVYPTEVFFIALAGVKSKVLGDIILSDLSLGNDQKKMASLSVEIAGSRTSVLDFVSRVLEGYPICDFVSLKLKDSSGIFDLRLDFYQNAIIQKEPVFAKLLPEEEALAKEVLGVSISGGSEVNSPSSYSRDNPF